MKTAYSIHDIYSTIPCGCDAKTALAAYQNISFSPEKRADRELKDTQADIESLFNAMAPMITEDTREAAFAAFQEYVVKYKSKYNAYLYAKSNCISWMITGPAKFPVAKANKANAREERLHRLFIEWREKAFSGMCKRVFGSYATSGLILSDDPDAISLLRSKVERLERMQESMKEINKAFKSFDKTKSLAEFFDSVGIDSPEQRRDLFHNISGWGARPYPGFYLTNNNARLKSTKERLQRLEKYQELKTSQIKIGDVEIVQNTEIMRLQIFFPDKPDTKTISELKHRGFRWSPSQGAWQRQDTNRAHYEARNIVCGYNDRQGEK